MSSVVIKLLKFVLRALLLTAGLILVLPLIPNLPPPLKITEFSVTDPLPLEGPLSLSNLCLNNSQRLFENEIKGPEGFTILNGELYTTLHGGYVAKLSRNRLVPVVKFGKGCDDYTKEAECGRPLGVFAVAPNLLYVMDAYYGMFKYNVDTKESQRLVAPGQSIAGRAPKLFNSVTVAKDGSIYWTDSSSDITLQDGLISMLVDGTGRLFKLDPRTGENKVLIDGILFANGVALAPDESFVLVAETGRSRLLRYWLKGPQANTWETFIDGLPGLPDNLRAGRDGFLVPLVVARDANTPQLSHVLAPFPYIRKGIIRLLVGLESIFSWIHSSFPNEFCRRAVHFIGHFEMSSLITPARVTILYVDTQGQIKHSFHALDGSVIGISDAIIYKGALYLGSPFNTYLGVATCPKMVAKLQEHFPDRSEDKYSTVKSTTTTTTTTPKPTTTTTKPTTKPQTKPTTKTATTTPKPTTTTTTTTPKPTTTTTTTTTTPKPATTTSKPTTTDSPTTTKTTEKPKRKEL